VTVLGYKSSQIILNYFLRPGFSGSGAFASMAIYVRIEVLKTQECGGTQRFRMEIDGNTAYPWCKLSA